MVQCQGRAVRSDQDLDRIKAREATHLVNIYIHFDDPRQLMGCSTAEGIKKMQELATSNNRFHKVDGSRPSRFGQVLLRHLDMKLQICGSPIILEENDSHERVINEDFTGNFSHLTTRVVPVSEFSQAQALNSEAPSGMPDFIRFDPKEHDMARCDKSAVFGNCGTHNALDNDLNNDLGVRLKTRQRSKGGDGGNGPARGAARSLGVLRN